MKFKTSASLMVAIVLGLITAKVGLDILKKNTQATSGGPAGRVVVAKKDMEPGYVIEAEDIGLQEVPLGMVNAKTFRDTKTVVGRTVVASLVAGYPMSETVVTAEGSGGGMQAMVPAGFRAVTVDVSESSGVAGLLTPGCHVDVIATLHNGDQAVARTVVENAKVQFIQRDRSTSGRTGASVATGTPDLGPVKTVTLLVTPKQAAMIELANSSGKPRLVLRGNSDSTAGGDTNVSQNELLGNPDQPKADAPQPAPPTDAFSNTAEPPKGRPVQIIRGGQESVITYDEKQKEESGTGAAPASGKSNKPAGEEQRTLSGTSPDKAPRTDASRENLRKGL
jgi:pilus assembly protein CpaB